MNKRKSLMLIISIIVSFILICCNPTLKQSKENEDRDTNNRVVSKKSARTKDNKIMKNDRKGKRNTNDQIQLEKDKVPKNKKDVSSNMDNNLLNKEVDSLIVIPNNGRPVDNLKSNTKQSDKQAVAKRPIIKDKPIAEYKHIEHEPPIEETIIPEENIPPEIIEEDNVLCGNAWFDESKSCDYIPENLKPTDELGRKVPRFFTSQEAWDWGEAQIEDDSSKYSCRGFTRINGYQNDGKQFFFAYLKICESN